MDYSTIRYEIDDGLLRLTLNRPAQFNSLSEEMLAALQDALDRIAADESARVVVLAGAGSDLLDIEVFGNEFAHPVLGLGA